MPSAARPVASSSAIPKSVGNDRDRISPAGSSIQAQT